MLAHRNKSNLGIYGFDAVNLFTNDEIFCAGFEPSPSDVNLIDQLISDLNALAYSHQPICLYINRKNDLYWMDVKLYCMGDPLFADSQNPTLTEAINSLKKKIKDQIPFATYSLEDFQAMAINQI